MSPKHDTTVLIGGERFTLAGDEGEEYIQRVALYINNKLDEMRKSENARQLNSRLISVLLDINIADDYFKAKAHSDSLETALQDKIKRIEDLEKENLRIQVAMDDMVLEKAGLTTQMETLTAQMETLKQDAHRCKAELDEYIEAFDSK